MKLRLPHVLLKALGCVFGVAVTTLGTSNSYGAGMHSQVSIVTYTDFGQNMGRYRVNGVNALLSGIRTRDGGVVLTYQDAIADPTKPHEVTAAPADYTMTTPMISFESQGENGAYAAIGYNYIATVQHNGCQNPTFTNRYIAGTDSLHYYGVEYRDALTFCLVAQSDDQTKTHDYKVTRLNRLITDVTPSTPASPMSVEEILALKGTMEYRSGAGTMSLWSLDGTNTSLASAYVYAIGGMRLINGSSVDDAQNGFFTTVSTMEYGAEGLSTSDPLPFAPAGGDSGSPVWIWDEGSQSYVYLDAYQSIFGVPGGGARGANARGDLDYTWKALQKFDKAVDASGGTVHIKGVVATEGDTEIRETTKDNTYATKLHMGSVVDAQGNTVEFVGVKGNNNEYINTWLNLAPEKDKANWFAYDNKYYNVGVYNKVQRELNIEDLFFTENLVFRASAATGNTVLVDADTDLGIGYVQFSIAPDAGLDHADFTLQSNGQTSGGKDGAQRDFMLNSAGFVVDANVNLHVKLTNTEWDSDTNDYYYREWRKVGDGNLYLEGAGNNEVLLNVGGSGTTYLNETNGYAAYNVYVGSGSTVVIANTAQIARDFTFGYNGGVLDIRGNNSMDWHRTNTNVAAQGFSINSFSEDSYITNSLADTTLNLTYKAGGSTEYIGSFVDTKDGGAVCITFDAGSGASTTLHGIHTSLANAGSGITVHSGTVALSGTNTIHGLGSATGRNADRYLSTDDWHYADMATKVQVDNGAVFELGSHARLTGDVTVKAGGRLMVREGVHSTYEYIEGGLRLEDTTTAFYREYYGLKGNVSTEAGSTVEFSYSSGTTAEQVYAGNITGGANVVISLGGSGATLRLSGTNTFSGSKMLSGGGLISDNGLAALGNTDSTHWLVADTAFIAASGTSGSELLGKLNTSSTGVLALTRNQAADLELQANGYSGLIVGALAGQEIHYGTQEDSLTTVQNGGKDRWLLGGGGGNLIVDFALVNKDAELVIGNAHTSGTVTLTNENNHFASITLNGQMMLEYTSEAALGGAKTTLNYTNRLMSLGAGVLSSVTEDSTGVVLVDRVPGAAFDLSNHQGLYIGASADTELTNAPTVASGSAYRFGGIDGVLTVNAELANAGGQVTGLVVDGQTFSGGVLELGQAAAITGEVTVRGYDPDLLPSGMPGKGDITLRLSAENALANAARVDVASGGTIDIHGTTQSLRNLSMASGSLVTDSSPGYSGVLDLDITAASTISGTLDVRQVNKRGSETLQLYGTSIVDAYDVYEGTLKALSTSSISGNVTVHDGATIELAGGNTGINLSMGDGSKLRVTSGTATVGSLTVADNATVTLLSGGTLKFSGAESISKVGTTINLQGGSLDVSADQDLLFGSRIQASGNAESKLSISGGTADKSYARRFEHISVEQGSTLTLEQTVQETTPMYEIHGLSGQGTFVISQGTYKDAPTFYKFNRDTDFAGTLKLVAGTAYSGRAYMSHTLIQSDNALANAQVQMQGWLNNSNGIITLGIDTENASIKGLATLQNNRSVLMAGATTATTAGALPVSSRRATLTITGSESTEFTGQVVGGASGTDHGLSIVMDGTGTQTFSGVSVFNDVSALKGTLKITNSDANTAIKGDLTVARGATLNISKAYTLGSGKTLHVVGDSSADTATLTAPITISGGTIDFSGDALNDSTAALHLSSTISGSATISFSDTSQLQDGITYKLADGNWSNITLTTASLDYLTASVSATSTGLTASFSLSDNSYIWDGNSAKHTWTTTNFGQQDRSFQSTYRAVFTDTAESKDVQVTESISAASLVLDSAGEYTFSGSGLVTAASLSQLAPGTTNIGSSVKITGQAHVQAGTLAMHSGASTGSVQVEKDGTLSLKDAGISTGEISGNGTLAIDWGSQSGGIPTIGSSGIGSLNVVSGTLSITDIPNVQRGIFVGGNGILELNYANNGTLDKSISGIGDSRGKVAKAGNGTLTVAAGITADSLTVSGGSVVVNKEASLDLNSLAIGNAKAVVLHRDGNSVRNIGKVQMDLSAKLTLYSDAEPSTAMKVDSLELYGAYASVVQENISGAILFRSLSRKGSTDVTLNLDSTAAYQKISVFELGGADDTPGDFSGEITLNCTSGSQYNRSSALLLDDANVAAGAVINLKSAKSPAAVLGFGVNAPVVNIAGLTSNSAIGTRARLFSGSVAPSTMLSDEAFAGSDETHKLVITTASGKDYSYYGSIGRNVDLTVAGSGTQRLLGTGTAFSGMLTVQGGTLEIGNAESFGSASESGGFGVTLAGGTLVLSGGSLNLGNASLVLAQDTTVSMGTAGSYSYQDGNDSENGFSLMTVIKSGSVDNQGGTVTGAGALSGKELRIMENGVFALDPDHRNTYYVNTTVDYGPQASGSAYANADSLVLNHDGAVLNMQAGLSSAAQAKGITAAVAGGTVNLGAGVTLQASSLTANAATKLAGGGTYTLARNDKNLGSKLTLTSGWTGRVVMSGTGMTGVGLNYSDPGVTNALATALSSIELRGVQGWLANTASNNAKLILTNPDGNTSALKLTDGSSTFVTYFQGDISGTGDLESAWNKNANVRFEMQGNLGSWTGNIVKSAGSESTFTLKDNPGGTIAVGALAKAGKLNIIVDNSSPMTLTGNFGQDGGKLNMTVAAGTDASFTGNVTGVSSVTLAGTATFSGTNALTDITVEDGASLCIAGGTTSISGSVSLAEQVQNTGVIDFGGNALTISLADDAAAFGVKSEGYTGITGEEGDNGFHHGVYGTVIEGDGTIAGSGHVTVSFNGAAHALNADGTFGTVDTTTYHVRKGSVDYGTELAGTASITSVALYEDATLNLNTALVANVGIASTGGTVNIGNAVALQAAFLTANAATTLAGGGTYALANANGMPANVQLSGNAWAGTVSFTGASSTLDLAGTWVGSGTAASTVEFRDWSGSFAGNSATIGARVQLSSGTAMALSSAVETTVAFTNGVGGNADIEHSGAGRLNLSFTGDDVAWQGTFVNSDGTAEITYSNIGSVANSIFAMDGSVNVHLNNVGTYHGGISNASLHVSGTAAFNGSGYLTSLDIAQNANFSVGGSTTVMGNVDAGGTLAVAGGATLSIQGSITRLAAQIANNGTLDFGGRSAGVSLTGDGTAFHIKEAGYTNIAGEEDENGFSHSLMGDLASGSGNIANGGNVAITFGSSSFTGLNADGTFGTMDWTTYHVRSGVVDYGSDMAGATSITTVAVSNNATINVNTGLANGVGITSAGGSINIAENVALDHASIQASAPTTLGGRGKLVLANNSITMPDNVTLGTDWEGVVAVSGVSLSGTFTPAPLSNDNSWIEVKGLSGYLSTGANSTYVVSNNLVLAGDADGWAFKQTDGYGGSTVSFTGTLKGSGNLGRSKGTGSNYTYEFSGDISGWNGKFISRNNDNCYTMFRVSGDASVINAELVNSGTDFRVEVQTDAMFNGKVNATSLSVGSDSTVSFGKGAVAEIGSVNGLHHAIVNNGSLTIGTIGNIDGMLLSEQSEYDHGEDSDKNGFLVAGKVEVVKLGDGAQLSVTNGPTSYNGSAGTFDAETGLFTISSTEADLSTFYLNKEFTTENLANAISNGQGKLTTIQMTGGTTLSAANVKPEDAVSTLRVTAGLDSTLPVAIAAGTATFDYLVREASHTAIIIGKLATLKINNAVEVAAGETVSTSGGGTFEATTLRSTGGRVELEGATLVSGGGSGQGGADNKLGLAITGNGGTIALNGGTTTVTGAVYTNAQNTAIEVGGGEQAATLVATRMELGDNGGGQGSLNIGANGKVVVTGDVNTRSGHKSVSLLLGEWGQSYTTNVQGQLLAKDAIAMLGHDNVQAVNVAGGTMAVKGMSSISESGDKNHNLSVTDGGRLILGESGIAAESGSWNIKVENSELGMTADTTIGRAMKLAGNVTVNTDKYEFSGTGADQKLLQGSSSGNMAISGALSTEAGSSATIIKTGSGKLDVSGSMENYTGSVDVRGGIMDIMNAAAVELQDVTIANGATVGVYTTPEKAEENTLHVYGTLTAGGSASKLNANVMMHEGSVLDVSATGGVNGLLMGSEVTLSKGMTLNDYSDEWASWEVGTKYALFTGVDGLDLGNGVTTGTLDYTQWVDAKEYFDNIQESNRYFLCYGGAPNQNAVGVLTSVNNGSNVGMVYILAMPEPTTSTLSLLALAGLAARRRRK